MCEIPLQLPGSELKVCGSVDTHCFEGAVAGKAVRVQRLRTVLTWRNELVQYITDILIVAAP